MPALCFTFTTLMLTHQRFTIRNCPFYKLEKTLIQIQAGRYSIAEWVNPLVLCAVLIGDKLQNVHNDQDRIFIQPQTLKTHYQ